MTDGALSGLDNMMLVDDLEELDSIKPASPSDSSSDSSSDSRLGGGDCNRTRLEVPQRRLGGPLRTMLSLHGWQQTCIGRHFTRLSA